MSNDIESKLRAALRPVQPSDEFTQRLVAQVTAQQAAQQAAKTTARHRPAARGPRYGWWVSASLAASLLIAVGVQRHVQENRERENGAEARREVVEALRMTSQKLNLAYEAVKSQSPVSGGEQPSA
jgi:hypothetical protein